MEPSGTVSSANYLRYLIESAWDWGIAIGWDTNYSQNPDVFWLIRETEIRLIRPLHHNDVFDFTIWLANWQRVRGTRCFELKRKESGDVIAQGTQQIVYMDAKTGRPKNMSDALIDTFRIEDPRIFPFERFPKMTPLETAHRTRRQVEAMDLDMYDHVNNAIYIDYVNEAVAQDFSSRGWSHAKLAETNLGIVTRRVHIQYSSIAEWGETLNISTNIFKINDTGGSSYVCMARADGSAVADCIMDWELVDRKTGEARALPPGLC